MPTIKEEKEAQAVIEQITKSPPISAEGAHSIAQEIQQAFAKGVKPDGFDLKALKLARWVQFALGVRQMRQSLALYRQRGEFDGTPESARECLELACYEPTEEEIQAAIAP